LKKKDQFCAFGEYVQNGRVYAYEYDLKDTRYRVFSDQWMTLVGTDESTYEVFDLVGNFEFLSDFSYVESIKKVVFDVNNGYYERELEIKRAIHARKSIVQPFFVEPFDTDRQPLPGYSVIGPWEGDIIMGVREKFYTPYMTPRLDVMTEGDFYSDISDRCEVTDTELKVDGCVISLVNTHQYFVKRFKDTMKKEEKKNNPGLSMTGFKVFILDPGGNYKFVYVPYRVYSYPYNGEGSIIYPMRFASLLSIIAMDKYTTMKEFLPMAVLLKKTMLDPLVSFSAPDPNEVVDPIDVLESVRVRTRCRYAIAAHVSEAQFFEFLNYCEDRRMVGNLVCKKGYLTGDLEMCSRRDIEKYEHYIKEVLNVQNNVREIKILVSYE